MYRLPQLYQLSEQVKDRRVIVGCATEDERKKVKERLGKVSDRLNVEDVTNKNPLVMLKDVLSYNTDQEVLGALEKQNNAIFKGLEEDRKKVEICFRSVCALAHKCAPVRI
ncbi:jg25028 [Pararge aegeria aegeria]|uniref:Jg25028 protein n=1 Tax=Pararge aegeria aegeria TaxID=348720 RepID=A0A8S4R3N8_9NEOP|nr:jg25028 [Pararge aegeria aegeria]